MTPQDYVALALRTAKWFPVPEMTAIHAAMGLMSEAGELSEVEVRSALDLPIPKHSTTKSAVVEEFGDLLWFLVYAGTHHGLDVGKLITGTLGWFDPKSPPEYAQILESPIAWEVIYSYSELMSAACSVYGTLIKAKAVYNKPVESKDIHDSLVFIGLCLLAVLRECRLTFDEVAPANIEKLRKRYPDKYSDEFAIARLDKTETP